MDQSSNTISRDTGMRCKRCQYDLRELRSRTCPECGTPFDSDDPKTYESEPRFVWLGRLATNVTIALLAASVLSLGIVWLMAWRDGHIAYLHQYLSTPPGMRGNHGPWRRWDVASIGCTRGMTMMQVAMLTAWIGLALERSLRALIVLLLLIVTGLALFITHAWLID